MEEKEIMEVAKEAYILSQQLKALEEGFNDRDGKNVWGYKSYAENYNQILERGKELLKIDETIFKTIEHLQTYNPQKEQGYAEDFYEIKGDIPILKEAFSTFFKFHFPKKEKERIGFRLES